MDPLRLRVHLHSRALACGTLVVLSAALGLASSGNAASGRDALNRRDRGADRPSRVPAPPPADGFELRSTRSRASAPRAASGPFAPPETVWVAYNPAYAGSNYWSIGRGPARPGVDNSGIWGWQAPVHGDTLQGWWPFRRAYSITGGLTLADYARPWWALDYGNQVNYTIRQGSGFKRTFGLSGVWHRDLGSAAGGGVTWTPLGGSASAWCGLRRHGDNSVVDAVTGNPFNQAALQFNGENSPLAGGTSRNFPGYASQWDQMLYRDFSIAGAPGPNVTVSFKVRTRMSTGKDVASATRTGWFDKDPLAVVANNFVSSTNAGTAAPVDSFMVYVGNPVLDAQTWTGSDGNSYPVFDPQRRWFAEVVRANQPGMHYELYSVSGDNQLTVTKLIPLASLQPWGNRVRLVFRVKTNRGFDDQDSGESGYSSNGAGAAQIDDVTINLGAGPVVLGDFESAGSIDNNPAVSALSAWKSTGRPPGIHPHPHSLDELLFDPEDPAECNLSGTVISMGDHDNGEAAGGPYGTAEQERMDGIVSPTVNLAAGGSANAMGIDQATAAATDDIYVRYELYTGIFDILNQGNAWTIGAQSYPAAQPGSGTACWGEPRVTSVQLIDDHKECLTDLVGLYRAGLIRTSNVGGIPDSIRIVLGKQQQCFRFGLTLDCSPVDGAYFDNVSLGFVDLPDKSELDEFPNSVAHVDLTGPVSDSSIVLTGPSSVHVYFSSLSDPDGDGREQVETEMVALNLTGSSPSTGPMTVRLRPTQKHPWVRSVGEIEETTNTLGGRLDLPPFAPSGTASSFFDVFFEVELPSLGLLLHNHEAHRVSSVIKHKPPQDDEVYVDLHPIRLYDENEMPTPYYIGAKHFPVPPPERDTFPNSWAAIELATDAGIELVKLRGPVRVDVDTFQVVDVDMDGREEFETEMVELQLTGQSSLGSMVVSLRNPAAHPNQRTLGRIEETANLTPQRLDLRPFVERDTTTATSFFDVFFQVDLPDLGMQVHNHAATVMSGVIRHKPPGPEDSYRSPLVLTNLFDQDENQVPFKVRSCIHKPYGRSERDTFPQSHLVVDVQGPWGFDQLVANGPTRVEVETDSTGAAFDIDGDGLDEVMTEMQQLDLVAPGGALGHIPGPVQIRLNPAKRSMGIIEETANSMGGRLDVPPFAAGGTANSYFDVFFEVDIPGFPTLHNDSTARIEGVIRHKPPGSGDTYYKIRRTPLVYANGQESGVVVERTRHTPDTGGSVGVAPEPVSSVLAIQAVEPNPTTGATSITLALPSRGRARLVAYDLHGRVVRKLLDRDLEAGTRTVNWDGADDRGRRLPAGLYFLRVEHLDRIAVRRVSIVR